jgi:transposase-like protein
MGPPQPFPLAVSGKITQIFLETQVIRGMSVETAMIERYRRQESSVEEALIEMSLAGVSVRLSSSPIIKQARGTVSGSMLSRPSGATKRFVC